MFSLYHNFHICQYVTINFYFKIYTYILFYCRNFDKIPIKTTNCIKDIFPFGYGGITNRRLVKRRKISLKSLMILVSYAIFFFLLFFICFRHVWQAFPICDFSAVPKGKIKSFKGDNMLYLLTEQKADWIPQTQYCLCLKKEAEKWLLLFYSILRWKSRRWLWLMNILTKQLLKIRKAA